MRLTRQRLIDIISEELNNTDTTTVKPISQTTTEIIDKLATLYSSLTEELDLVDDDILEGDGVISNVMQYMWWGPKAKKAQAKVNKVKLNVLALEFARSNEDRKEVKDKLTNKISAAKDQTKELQSMVDDKFDAKGNITKHFKQSEKIKGQLAIVKQTTGMTSNPNKKKDLKSQMKDLSDRYAYEISALKELEPTDDDKKSIADDLAKKKAGDDKKEIKNTEDDKKEPKKAEDDKKDKINRYGVLISKEEAKDNPDKNKIQKYNDKISQISAAESWMFNDTKFNRLIESELCVFEMNVTIIESKYQNLSIKDRFSMLF